MMTMIMAIAAMVSAPAATTILPGTWANPSKSVHVAFKPCGKAMCGTIIWANDKAKADAKRGGTSKLIGAVLFEDFVADGKARWRGAVFIPDIGQRVLGHDHAGKPPDDHWRRMPDRWTWVQITTLVAD